MWFLLELLRNAGKFIGEKMCTLAAGTCLENFSVCWFVIKYCVISTPSVYGSVHKYVRAVDQGIGLCMY